MFDYYVYYIAEDIADRGDFLLDFLKNKNHSFTTLYFISRSDEFPTEEPLLHAFGSLLPLLSYHELLRWTTKDMFMRRHCLQPGTSRARTPVGWPFSQRPFLPLQEFHLIQKLWELWQRILPKPHHKYSQVNSLLLTLQKCP